MGPRGTLFSRGPTGNLDSSYNVETRMGDQENGKERVNFLFVLNFDKCKKIGNKNNNENE